jgi:hypothetical protein
MRVHVLVAAGLLTISTGAGGAAAQQVTRESVPGITNLARLETTIACAGAIKADVAIPEIKKMGFVSIVNLRESTEPGADVEREEALARAAGLRYFHVPFNGNSPNPRARSVPRITSGDRRWPVAPRGDSAPQRLVRRWG